MDNNKKNQGRVTASKTPEKESFFQALISSLFKSSNPEAEKKRKLKNLAKTISKTKYHAYYRPASGEMLAPFGKLIFDLYKAVSSAQTYFRNTQNPAIFKRQIINYILSENQLTLLDELDEQKILELAKTVPFSKPFPTLSSAGISSSFITSRGSLVFISSVIALLATPTIPLSIAFPRADFEPPCPPSSDVFAAVPAEPFPDAVPAEPPVESVASVAFA